MNTKSLKVCHLTSVHPAKDGRIFYKECTSLAKAGYDVTIVVAGAKDELCNGIKIVGVPVKKEGRLYRMLKVGKDVYTKALEIDAEIYHIHDPELLPFGLKLKRKGKKVIFDSHEFIGSQILIRDYIPYFLRNTISFAYKKLEAYICKRIDAVIEVCTVDGKDYFENRCKKRIFITNAPIYNSSQFNNSEKDSSVTKVSHIGGLTYERGILYLAEAISCIRMNCQLVLAGLFSSHEFENQIKKISGEKLDYKGVISPSDIQELLSECNIGVCTLLDTGQYGHIDVLPTKIYDYMMAGLPIIMSNFPYLVKFNNKYNIGICVNPSDPQEIASAIEYIIKHSDEAIEMGKNGQNLVMNNLNWKSQEIILLELYRSL